MLDFSLHLLDHLHRTLTAASFKSRSFHEYAGILSYQTRAVMMDGHDRPRRPRVLYPLSTDLIAASDALPSNVSRSSMVHSLIYSLGLLDLPYSSELDHSESSKEIEEDQDEDERLKLTRLLLGSDGSEGNAEMNASNKTSAMGLETAETMIPEPASRTQLEAYHSKAYLDILEEEEETTPAEEEAFGLVDVSALRSLRSI